MRPRRRFAPEPPRPARNELVNENIRSAQVRLIDEDGAQLGIQPTKEALEIAWAKNHGVRALRTANEVRLEGMLAFNKRLGYRTLYTEIVMRGPAA